MAGITVTITHDATTPQVVFDTALISDPDVLATGGFTFTAAEGSAFISGTVATFSDPGGLEEGSDYSATIDWGDGTTSAGTIVVDESGHATGEVTGSHTYSGDTISGESEGVAGITVKIGRAHV